jgi:hypothetical protein
MASAALITGISAIASLVGTAVAARGQQQAGQAAQASADFEAQQLAERGADERAQAQQESMQLRRRKELALSALQARAAASGFSATDESTKDLAGDIEKYGTLQEQMASYGGKKVNQRYRTAAAGAKYSGASAARGANLAAAGTVLSGISSFASSFPSSSGPSGSYVDNGSPFESGYRSNSRYGWYN